MPTLQTKLNYYFLSFFLNCTYSIFKLDYRKWQNIPLLWVFIPLFVNAYTLTKQCKHFYRSTLLVYKDRQIPHIFVLKMLSNSLLMATESFVNISFFSVMYYPCCIIRELGCYTAKVIRGNKEGGITKVFFTVIQDMYCIYGE